MPEQNLNIHSEVIKVINEIEDRFPVDQWKIDGIHVWPLARMYLVFTIKEASSSNSGIWSRIFRNLKRTLKIYFGFLYAFLRDSSNNANLAHQAKAVFLSDGVSYVNLLGKEYEKLCDPLISHLNSSGISTLLLNPGHNYLIPRHTPSKLIQPQLEWLRIKSFLSRSPRTLKTQLPNFQEFLNFLRTDLKINSFSLLQFKRYVLLVRSYANYYEKILRKTKPSICFMSQYYGFTFFGFIIAAKNLGIKTVDIQHGLQGGKHPMYARWNRVPKTGYELLPSRFWCWSEFETQAINQWASHFSPLHKTILGGNIFLKLWQNGKEDFVGYYNNAIKRKINADSTKINVLVTLQDPLQMNTQFSELLITSIKRTSTNMRWWLRLHPLYKKVLGKNKTVLFSLANVEIDFPSSMPLYGLLQNLDVHVTQSSSTVFEAEAFGIFSVITHPRGWDIFADHIKAGVAIPATNAQELVDAVKIQYGKKLSFSQNRKDSDIALNRCYKTLMSLIT